MRRLLPLLALSIAAATAGPASAAVTGTVTIGMAHSETGPAAGFGVTQARGAQLAVDQLNVEGEFGFTLALDVRDDASTPDGAKAALTDLISAGAAALLGPTLSSAAFAADPVAQEAGVPLVAVSNTADGITQIGPYIFRTSLPERKQIPAAVRVAHRRLHFKRPVMVVRTDQPFAVSGAQAFRAALRRAGVPVVAKESYTGAPDNFRALLKRLAGHRPDVLIIESLTEGPQLMREARKLKAFRAVPFMGGNAFNSLSVIKDAGAAAEGLIVGAAWHPDEPGVVSRAFVKAYRKRFASVPDQFAAQAYTAVLVIANALSRAGTTDGATLRDALAGTSGVGSPLGLFAFGKSRDVTGGGIVQIVRDGRFRLLQ